MHQLSGVVSYRIDNLESVLTPNDFTNINKEFLDKLNLKTGAIVATSNQMGKIINNFECYIATVMNSEEAKKAKVGDKATIRLSTQDEAEAKIVDIKQDKNDSVIIIFKINNCVEKLIDYRKISIDVIWGKYSGLKIPKTAIIYDNGLSYIVRNRAGYLDKILVKILEESKNYCIIDNYTTTELQNLKYTIQEINNLKKIVIYDEILLNPDLSKI